MYVAGSNADNIGNQAGGWTLTWQGGSTTQIPGQTILDAIEDDASQVTFSQDASAPVPHNAIGVVVVGETPYSEGFGDVGGPLWAYDPGDNGVPRPPKTMQLSDADTAAVNTVCAQAAKCVVLVVSGRPMIIPPTMLAAHRRTGRELAAGQRGCGCCGRAVRQAAVHRPAAGDLAADRRTGADQHRRRELRPAVPVRLGTADPLTTSSANRSGRSSCSTYGVLA